MSRRRSGPWSLVGSTAATKIVVMGGSGVLGIITSRLIIQAYGTDAYAQYGLLTALPNLLPFADLGIAAVVINAVAESDDVRRDPQLRRTISTAFRILLVSGAVIAGVALLITLAGWWPILLGGGLVEGGATAAFACMAVFGIVLPLTVGQRLLVGVKRAHLQVAAQSIVAPFMFLSIGATVLFSIDAGSWIAVFSYIAGGLVSIVCLVVANRFLAPQLRHAVRDVPRIRAVPSVPVIALAWPMLVQMVALPIAMQTERILLSHLTRGDELAQYNLGSQLFGIVLQTIAAAGLALWPFYARARARSEVESPLRTSLWFLAGGLALGGALALVTPVLVEFVTNGAFELPPALVIAFVVFIALQAAKYPLGMYMTDAAGLRFQVLPIVLMVPLNLGLSWLLIVQMGAAGAVVASAVAVAVCQVVPNIWYVRRDVRRRRTAVAQPQHGIAAGSTDV